MTVFSYKAKNANGENVEGAVEADSESTASDLLRERGLKIESLEIQHRNLLHVEFNFLKRVTTKDLVIFSRQISVMVSASVSLVKALRTVGHQTTNPKLREIVVDIGDEVEGGVRLSDAVAKYPKVFNSFFVNMIRSGETSGQLDEVLLYLADQEEKDYELRSQVFGAMIYPIFVLSMLFVVGTVMMIFVVPKLTSVLAESGVALPITTRMLIGTSNFFVSYWYLIIGGVFGAIFGLRAAYGTPYGKRVIDAINLKIPIFGRLQRQIVIVRMTRGLSTLIEGGVDMVTSLKVVSGIVSNEVFREILIETVQEVAAGNSISSVWRRHPEFPSMVTQIVSVGEDTGKLKQVLDRLTTFYGHEVDATVRNLSSAIEPIIVVIMGIAVGAMVSAIILPMYSLAQQM